MSAERESVTDYTNIAFMGSNVVSGSATAVVVCTGDRTLFGSMASAIAGKRWKPASPRASTLFPGC